MTKKPRITVTLEPHAYEVLSRLSAAGGESMSQLVSGFLEIGIPSLERVVLLLEQAKAATGQTREGLKEALARAEGALLPAVAEAVLQNDLFLEDITTTLQRPTVPEASDVGGGTPPTARRKGEGAGQSTPVLVTRGSGTGKTRRVG